MIGDQGPSSPLRVIHLAAKYAVGAGRLIGTSGTVTGDFVVVVNASKVRLTGRKEEKKEYQRYSGYRGGQRSISIQTMRERHPDRIIKLAVWGMLPKNHQSRKVMTRLKVFPGSEHTHAAQKPEKLELV